ncbi:MAG: translation initiation factor IF-2 [Parcubacteria group bacterium]|jgi:translation initiation factor IF-2|nr:translation initiation factor IF-2 [Parcubacteria group bacterium]|tara:strand:- start:2294 stop:3802 length:1509 start_codon:yes stop_codon:yes gene_type:complete
MSKIKKRKQDNFQTKPPVVVILGHVDHGKSSILEAIKDLKITEKESGGITQHIGAYQVEHQDKKITFIDTPGHEAFSAMRSRGAKVADIAILVVAAEEGIKPQTKEAITIIKKIGLPVIVALNKIDKKEAQPERVKEELAKNGLIVESTGGQIPSVNLSAKNGQGIDELLEMLVLVAEINELKSPIDQPASGVIVESHRDNQRGATATLLVKQGTLRDKDIIGTDSTIGRVKTIEDFQSQPIEKATASTPVIITGLNQVPQVGEKFSVFETLEQAQIRVDKKTAKRKGEKEIFVVEPDKKILNIILKADVRGSLEAIKESFKSIPAEEVVLRILKAEIGDITESDIKLAESARAKIVGFRVKASSTIQELAQQKKVKVALFEIIYELIQGTRELLSKLLKPEIIKNVLGQLKVLALFRSEKDRQIIGGKVINGQIKQSASLNVVRADEKIGQGKIIKLQRDKKDAEEVNKNQECGILFKGTTTIEKGDILEAYEEEKKKREI